MCVCVCFYLTLSNSFVKLFLYCKVVCGFLIDSNSQNISVISSLKNTICMFVLGVRVCRLKANVQIQKEGV